MKKYIKFILATFVCTMLIFSSCSKSASSPKDDQNNLRRIKKSNKIIIDNANRVDRENADRIIESITYFYNDDDLLIQLNFYADTAAGTPLQAAWDVEYYNNIATLSSVTNSSVGLQFIHDNQKRVLVVKSIINGLDSIKFYYGDSNQISEIKIIDIFGQSKHHFDFIYDENNNLLAYKTIDRNNGNLVSRVALSYYPDYKIRNEFDSRFYREETRLYYLGGLNLIYMLGLNYGETTKNALKERIEYMPNLTGDTTTRTNQYTYTFNSENEIIYRKMTGSSDTLYYNFEYE